MYLEYYGLREAPFSMSPDPKFIYYTPVHKEALAQMDYAVRHNRGFMVLTGAVGTGKTSLINALKVYLPDTFKVNIISHAIFDPDGLIKSVCRGFGLDIRERSLQDLLFDLQELLESLHKNNRKPVLIFDEAQILTAELLEHIRLLSNIGSMDEMFIRIIFSGQPEFLKKLEDERLRPLTERISMRSDLRSLSPVETAEYIIYRLRIAGFPNGWKLFSERVLGLIYEYSKGIPRRINKYSDRTLMIGYSRDMKFIK